MPTIILQITMLLFVKREDLYWLVYFLKLPCYNNHKGGDIVDQAAFQKKYFWNILCLLCGLLIIGLFLFVGYKDSEATLSDKIAGIIWGAMICLFSIISLRFNFRAYLRIGEGRLRSKYHFFGEIDCKISDISFVLGRNNTLMLQLKHGKRHTIMGIENAYHLATVLRTGIFHIETASPDDLLLKLKKEQTAQKKKLLYTVGCVMLMFVNIFIAVLLTGGKELSAFTKMDWLLFTIMGLLEVMTVLFMFYIANQCGKHTFPIEQLKHQIKGAYIATAPLPAGIVKRVYTDANHMGRIVICGFPNDESVYYCTQEFVGNYLLKTVDTSQIYENEEQLLNGALSAFIDISDHFQ